MNAVKKPPIVVIEPEENQMVYITGADIEAIDAQTVQIVAWVDQPHTNSRKIVMRMACSLKLAMDMNTAMHKAIANVIHKLVDKGNEEERKLN